MLSPGHLWYTDISLQRPPDADGNTYSRLFAEEHTGFARTYRSPRKDSPTLTSQLDDHATWVRTNVPGASFMDEIVRQNHGDNILTTELSKL